MTKKIVKVRKLKVLHFLIFLLVIAIFILFLYLILNTKISRKNFYIWYVVTFDFYAPGEYNEVYSGVRCVIFKYMCSEEEKDFGKRCYGYIDFELNGGGGGKRSVFAVKVLKNHTMATLERPQKA